MNDRLFAKSWNEMKDGPIRPHVYLLGHLQDVVASADQIIESAGKAQLNAFGLNPDEWLERFRKMVRLAAAVHDLGKANDHFQGMISGDNSRRQKPQGFATGCCPRWASRAFAKPTGPS